MLFKDLKPGYPVYILQKENEPRAFQGKTIKVSEPIFRLLLSVKCRL